MVVSSLVQLAVAGMTGALFGVAYGTSIRIGYEIVYPALFGDKALSKDVDTTLKKMLTTFTAVGGLEAQAFGINQGIKNALKAIDADPELQELIKKNSLNDSLNIIVSQSGTSQTTSLDQSQLSDSSIKDQDFTGGLADRHRAARDALSGQTDANEFATLSQEYSNVFNAYESKQGQITEDQLERLTNVNTNSNVRIWFVEWNFHWFTFALKKKLVDRHNALTPTTTTKTTEFTIIKLTDHQLLQKYGGVSKQTIEIQLLADKDLMIRKKKSIQELEGKLASGGGTTFQKQAWSKILNDEITSFNKLQQKVWELTMELKRRLK